MQHYFMLKFKINICFFISLIANISCTHEVNTKIDFFYGDSFIKRWDLEYYFSDKNTNNKGIGGQTISELIKELNTLNYSDNICFIIIGTNDCMAKSNIMMNEIDILKSVIIEYDLLITTAKLKFKDIFIISLFPLGHQIEFGSRRYFKTLYPNINSELSKRVNTNSHLKFIDVYNLFTDKDGFLSTDFSLDGLHINAYGYNILSNEIRKYLQ
jgi:lysophospholipase L1-like esterase